MADYSRLTTESINEKTKNIDKMSAIEIAKVINDEDKTVAFAVEKALPQIAAGIDMLADSLKCGGHIYYCGAGTSGRLGVLDAAECPPTYGVGYDAVVGLMAGGVDAKTLSGILGHTNASFTLDTYTHVTTDMQRNASAIVGSFMDEIMLEGDDTNR